MLGFAPMRSLAFPNLGAIRFPPPRPPPSPLSHPVESLLGSTVFAVLSEGLTTFVGKFTTHFVKNPMELIAKIPSFLLYWKPSSPASITYPYYNPGKFALYSLITTATISFVVQRIISLPFRYYYSNVMNMLNRTPSPKRIINAFRNIDFDALNHPVLKGGHSHEASATNRSEVNRTMYHFANTVGLIPYSVQMSGFDQFSSLAGSRHYFWARDAHLRPQNNSLTSQHVRCITDVDYYMDMPHLLTTPGFVMLYTICPNVVARNVKEYSFNFNSTNEITYKVSGGGIYQHQIWNYNKDFVTATSYFLWTIPTSTTTYQIDRHKVGLDRDLVLLSPMTSYGVLGSILSYFMTAPTLQRLKVNFGPFNRLEIKTQTEHLISTAYCEPDQFSSATIPIETDNYIRNLAKIQSTPIAPYNVQSFLKYPPEQHQKALVESTILVGYHNSRLTLPLMYSYLAPIVPRAVIHTLFPNFNYKLDTVYPVEYATRQYQFGTELPSQPILSAFMSPFINEGYVPLKNKSNEQAAIDGRIDKVKCQDLPITNILKTTMMEFVDFLIPNPHVLHPTGVDEVHERQNRPSQRSILHRAMFLPLTHLKQRTMEFFIKAESYSKPADPRIISTMNPTTKLTSSEFMYAFANSFITQPFYAFGKTPEEIAAKVANICISSENVSLSDFSRMDGHISNVLRELDKAVLLRAFAPEHHDELDKMINNLTNLNAVGPFGTRFNSTNAQCSGDPWTAILNSIRNAFIHYRARRSMKNGNNFYSPDEAWTWLQTQVMVGGDDGIAGDMPERPLAKSCKDVGQVLEYEHVSKGQPGINFLSRFYTSDVWYGDPNSCCDVKRQLIKFHLSTKLPQTVTPVQKLVEKCRSFLMTDANTPIIGPFVAKVMELQRSQLPNYVPPSPDAVRTLQSWVSTQGPVPNNPHEDYHRLLQTALPNAVTFERTFLDWLGQVTTLEQMLSPCLLQPMTAPIPHPTCETVIDNFCIPPSTASLSPPQQVSPPTLPKQKRALPPPPRVSPLPAKLPTSKGPDRKIPLKPTKQPEPEPEPLIESIVPIPSEPPRPLISEVEEYTPKFKFGSPTFAVTIPSTRKQRKRKKSPLKKEPDRKNLIIQIVPKSVNG